MEEAKIAVPRFLKKLPRRNNENYNRLKAFFKFIFLLNSAFAIGFLISNFCTSVLSEDNEMHKIVSDYFCGAFHGCERIRDYIIDVFQASSRDLRILIFAVLCGFTRFSNAASVFITLLRGFIAGVSLGYLNFTTRSVQLSSDICKYTFAIYAAYEILTALIFVFVASKALCFSYEFQYIRHGHYKAREKSAVANYALVCFAAIMLILMINTANCVVRLLMYG